MVHVQPVRARLPRRRAVRARVGVLEDVRGAAGDGLGSGLAMNVLGNGLSAAKHHEDALSVREAELAMVRRLGASEEQTLLIVQGNLATTYESLDGRGGPADAARRILRTFEAHGEEHEGPS